MSKTQVQQAVAVLLLLAFAAIWHLTQKPSKTPPTTPSAGAKPSAAAAHPKDSASMEEDDSSTPTPKTPSAPLQEELPVRDFFELPPSMKEVIHQRELAEQQEQERKKNPQGPAIAPQSPPSLQLQGLVWGGKPKALINRKLLFVGDAIEGAKVLSITKEIVTMSYNGQEFQLKLPNRGNDGMQPRERGELL